MKKILILTNLVLLAVIVLGVIAKLQHWPVADVLLLAGLVARWLLPFGFIWLMMLLLKRT